MKRESDRESNTPEHDPLHVASVVLEDSAAVLALGMTPLQISQCLARALLSARSAGTRTVPTSGAYRWIEDAVPMLKRLRVLLEKEHIGKRPTDPLSPGCPECDPIIAVDNMLMGVPTPQVDLGFNSPADRAAQSATERTDEPPRYIGGFCRDREVCLEEAKRLRSLIPGCDCDNYLQCWEQCGRLGHSEKHARVVPSEGERCIRCGAVVTAENATHTPPPWEVKWNRVTVAILDSAGNYITENVRAVPNQRANALLIAAAPRLYEACAAAEAALCNGGTFPINGETWHMLKKALLLARGG